MIEMKEWDGFEGRLWKEEINVRQFIQDNYTPYDLSLIHILDEIGHFFPKTVCLWYTSY